MSEIGQIKSGATAQNEERYLTAQVGKERIAFPVSGIRDVIVFEHVAPVPLAPPQIMGILNLRGQVVTALHLQSCLEKNVTDKSNLKHSIVMSFEGDLYCLVVDSVGEVMIFDSAKRDQPPNSLKSGWKTYCTGIYPQGRDLILQLDIQALLNDMVSANDQKGR